MWLNKIVPTALGACLLVASCEGAGVAPDTFEPRTAAATGDGTNSPPTVNAGDDATVDEAASLTLTATASDPDGDGLTYHWSYTAVQGNYFLPRCTLGSPDAAVTTITCDNDGPITATVTVSDGVNAPVSDSVAITVRDVQGTAQLLAPPPVTVARQGSVIDGAMLIQEPALGDIPVCLMFRLTDTMQRNAVRPAFDASGRLMCNWHTDYLTRLTGLHQVIWQLVELGDNTHDVLLENQLIVYDPDPRQSASGDGELTVGSDRARVSFAASYPRPDATAPTGSVRFKDPAAGIDFTGRSFDWFVFQRDEDFDGNVAAPDSIAISGRGKNRGDHDCQFLLQARGPRPPQAQAGERWGEVRIQITCGAEVFDTDPSFHVLLTPLSSGSVQLVY
jgi:hypothetical protein